MTDKIGIPESVQSQINKLKAEGHAVFSINISGVKYIYRSINREEYRLVQEKLTTDAEKVRLEAEALKKDLKPGDPKLAEINLKIEKEALRMRDDGEDLLLQKGLIHPALTANTPAGVATAIADRIMQSSGFGIEEEPDQL